MTSLVEELKYAETRLEMAMDEHDGVETRKISWRELWAVDANHIKFIVGATDGVLPTPQSLRQ